MFRLTVFKKGVPPVVLQEMVEVSTPLADIVLGVKIKELMTGGGNAVVVDVVDVVVVGANVVVVVVGADVVVEVVEVVVGADVVVEVVEVVVEVVEVVVEVVEVVVGADVVVEVVEVVVGPEYVTGSSRMKAGTAQKLVLNMISTATMIRLGRVKGNKMVDMQLSNHKLVLRAIRMVREATGVSDELAAELLEKHGSVRNAVDAFQAN
jgi:hypothetical protein